MTTYNTGNPIGSKDPRDLYDNAENLDTAVNDTNRDTWSDRFGVARKTWHGMEQDFQQFLINSGYENIGDYAAGLEITTRNQIFWRDGELYRASAALELPYTATGNWATEGGSFVAVGDAALRGDLSMGQGAQLIKYEDSTVAEGLHRALTEKELVYFPEMFFGEESTHTEAFKRMFSAAFADGAVVKATGSYVLDATLEGIEVSVNTDLSQATITCTTAEDVPEWWEETKIFSVPQESTDVSSLFTSSLSKRDRKTSILGLNGWVSFSTDEVVMLRYDGDSPASPQSKAEVNVVRRDGSLLYTNYYHFDHNITQVLYKPLKPRLEFKLPHITLDGANIASTVHVTRNNVDLKVGVIEGINNALSQAFISLEDCCETTVEGGSISTDYSGVYRGGYFLSYLRACGVKMVGIEATKVPAGADGNYSRDITALDCIVRGVGGHFSMSDIHIERCRFNRHNSAQGWGYFRVINCEHHLDFDSVSSVSTRSDYANSWEGLITVKGLDVYLAKESDRYICVSASAPAKDHQFMSYCPNIDVSDLRMHIDEAAGAGNLSEIRVISLGYSGNGVFEKNQYLPEYVKLKGVSLEGRGTFPRVDCRPIYNQRRYSNLSSSEIGQINIHGLFYCEIEDVELARAGASDLGGYYGVQTFDFDQHGPKQRYYINRSSNCVPVIRGHAGEPYFVINNSSLHFGVVEEMSNRSQNSYAEVHLNNCTVYNPMVYKQGSYRCAMMFFNDCLFDWIGRSPFNTQLNADNMKTLGEELVSAPNATVISIQGCRGALEQGGVSYNSTFKGWLDDYKNTSFYV